jgi:hypothetical protein
MSVKVCVTQSELSVPLIYSRIHNYYLLAGTANQLASCYVQVMPTGPERDKESNDTLLVFDSQIADKIGLEFKLTEPALESLAPPKDGPRTLNLIIPPTINLGLVQNQLMYIFETVKRWFSLAATSIKTSYPGCSRMEDTHGGLVKIDFAGDINSTTLAKIKLILDHQIWNLAPTKNQCHKFFRTEWIEQQVPTKTPEPPVSTNETPIKVTTWAERVANGNLKQKSQQLPLKIDDTREDSSSYTVEPRDPIEEVS